MQAIWSDNSLLPFTRLKCTIKTPEKCVKFGQTFKKSNEKLKQNEKR